MLIYYHFYLAKNLKFNFAVLPINNLSSSGFFIPGASIIILFKPCDKIEGSFVPI
jgi:hypothetical protein